MDEYVIVWVIVGAVIGWLASQIMVKGRLEGLNDILAGVAGAVVVGFLFKNSLLGGTHAPMLGHVVNASIGAVVGTFATRFYVQYQASSADSAKKNR